MTSTNVVDNLNSVQQRLRSACQQFNRVEASVQLLAVSKTKPCDDIRQAYDAGQRQFGENYLQEALEKINTLSDLDIEWHFIGPLQSNKTRPAAKNFDWVHTVDRLKVAQRLNDQRPDELPPLNICLQVNIDRSASKSGADPDEVLALAKQLCQLPKLSLRGLMVIPAPAGTEAQQRQPFAAARQLLETLKAELGDHAPLDTLSMGMSGDLLAAVAEGATMVRIGTDIFGARSYPKS